jgi:cytidylate kinase
LQFDDIRVLCLKRIFMARALTIDSPVGAGGTTVAEALGIPSIATSLFYRAYSEGMQRSGATLEKEMTDQLFVASWLGNGNKERFAMVGKTILMDGEDITSVCRTEPNDKGSSLLAGQRVVRAAVNRITVDMVMAHEDDLVVTEGRNECALHLDAGSLAFGLYLTAAPETRALRRFEQRKDLSTLTLGETLQEVVARDYKDMTRDLEPLAPCDTILDKVITISDIPDRVAGRQLLIPTDHLSIRQVVGMAELAIGRYTVS